ncbi:transcription factor IIIC subunit delta N-term-domain-containing protein [Pisolithus marmoratus]|nr:transcription factor IIIC subunit delta N-term-domain-containing protein [Pisolithus marmoratus]
MTHPIYTALTLSTVIPHQNCLEWSDDGQLCVLTKSAVYILTPDHGIALSTPPDVKAPVDDQSSAKPLGWYKTMIDISSLPVRVWAEISDSWGALSLGSLDVSVQAVACSPSGLSSYGRCVLAVLNTNMEVTLWEGTKNHLKGEWCMIDNVTDHLVDAIASNGAAHQEVLNAQTTCIAWSAQPDFGISPAPLLDASLLATGSRAGSITLRRFSRSLGERGQPTTTVVAKLEMCERWITQLAWSQWAVSGATKCTAILAYAMSDGGIGLLQVSQTLEAAVSPDAFIYDYDVERHVRVDIEPFRDLAILPDKRAITTMRWVDVPGRNAILVASKAGTVHLYSLPPFSLPPPSPLPYPSICSLTHWYGSKCLFVQIQQTSAGSSSLSPVSGLFYARDRDALLLALTDGSVHAILGFSSEPTWDPAPTSSLPPLPATPMIVDDAEQEDSSTGRNQTTAEMRAGSTTDGHTSTTRDTTTTRNSDMPIRSATLTKSSRSFFVRAYQHTSAGGSSVPDYMDVNRIDGFVLYDSCGTVAWIYEVSRPTDFSYKHEAKHACVLLVTPFWSADDEWMVKTIEEMMDWSKSGSGVRSAARVVPAHLLRGIFLHLADTTRFERLCRALLNLLEHDIQEDPSTTVIIPEWTRPYSEEIKIRLRKSFATHFFGWDSLLSIRMKLALADECWKLCRDAQMRNDCGQVARTQLAAISHRVLRILVRHLTAIVTTLSPADVPFVLRVVVQSLLPGSPVDLSSEAQALSDKVNAMLTVEPGGVGLHETCPACHVEVPLRDITQATCLKGHIWARCSVTSFILSTAMVRTCIGCNRKALLPPSQSSPAEDDSWMPVATRSWVVKELLEAVDRCLFCGNSFVRVV